MSLRFRPISIYFHGFTIIIGGLFFNFIKIVILGYTMVYHIFIPPFRTTPNTLAPVPLQFKAGNPMMNLRLGATFTKIGIGLWHWVTHILPFLMVVFQFLMVPWFWVCTFLMVDLEFRLSRLHPIFGSFFIQHPVFLHHLAIPRRIADGRHHQEVTAGVPIEGRHPQVPLWDRRWGNHWFQTNFWLV